MLVHVTHKKILRVGLTRKTFVDEQEAAGWFNSLHVLSLIWKLCRVQLLRSPGGEEQLLTVRRHNVPPLSA